jgi:DNA-binding transcriptional MerR regulator
MQQQNKEWDQLESDREKNIYTLDWMIDHIVHEQSDDPAFEQFLKDIRASYAGEAKSDYKSRDEINDEDAALQQFKKDLTTKGAVKFLYDFNMEKIEEMVEKYKEELLKNLGDNPTPEELAGVEKMVENYRKKLLEQLAEINDKDKNSSLNINRLEFEMMSKLDSKLEEALKYI